MEDEWYYWVELTDDRFFKILRKDLDRKWEDEHAITFYAKNGNIHSFQRRHVLYWKLVSGETK